MIYLGGQLTLYTFKTKTHDFQPTSYMLSLLLLTY